MNISARVRLCLFAKTRLGESQRERKKSCEIKCGEINEHLTVTSGRRNITDIIKEGAGHTHLDNSLILLFVVTPCVKSFCLNIPIICLDIELSLLKGRLT